MALGSTHPLTEMSTRNLAWGKKGPPSMSRMSENVGASTSRNPKGLHGLLTGITLPYLTLSYCSRKISTPIC
jgi:hypothetical protein